MNALATALATLGGIGRLPFAPGSWGSLLAILLVPAVLGWIGDTGFAIATLLVTLIG
ncbi:MAG: phosphatidylglycerophosphatase A, partial [Alphaproteobacteria bacterium]